MAYLMLYGNGWTQRWNIADGKEDFVRTEICQIGREGTGQLPVVDPRTDAPTTLVVAWAAVAAAVVLGPDAGPSQAEATGQYA